MSSDRNKRSVRRPRPITRPQIPPGPLADLKAQVYRLYLDAGAPNLDEIAQWIADDDTMAGAPDRATIHRIVRDDTLPPSQADVAAVVTALARAARWDTAEATAQARSLWVAARLEPEVGVPLDTATDPFVLEVHRPITLEGTGEPVVVKSSETGCG